MTKKGRPEMLRGKFTIFSWWSANQDKIYQVVRESEQVENHWARVGFEPATFRTQGTEPTTEPQHNTTGACTTGPPPLFFTKLISKPNKEVIFKIRTKQKAMKLSCKSIRYVRGRPEYISLL